MTTPFDLPAIRDQFPSLARQVDGRPAVYFDGPAGSQVPRRVADAVRDYLLTRNANHGGVFATSLESDELLDDAHRAFADLYGASDPEEIVFGANMTSLTFALSRALARTWREGDEIIVCRSEHDANFSPWRLAARDVGVMVHEAGIDGPEGRVNLDDVRARLGARTRLVAVSCASNALGTRQPFEEITRLAHEAGALVFLDAVHFAPHASIDVAAWGCDFLVSSAYKYFGPHVGILWGRRDLLESIPAYKVRPASDSIPDRWMTGTQSHEGIAGAKEAVEYLADLGRSGGDARLDRARALRAAFVRIEAHERTLVARLLEGLGAIDALRVYGVTDLERLDERVPTVSFADRRESPDALARRLAARGIFSWAGNFYAQPLTEALGVEPAGLLRVGVLHYNSEEEVDRLLDALRGD